MDDYRRKILIILNFIVVVIPVVFLKINFYKIYHSIFLQYFQSVNDDWYRLSAQIPRFDKVVIMGLSCGSQGEMHVREVIKYASVIDSYYYDDNTKENFDSLLENSDITVQYHKW